MTTERDKLIRAILTTYTGDPDDEIGEARIEELADRWPALHRVLESLIAVEGTAMTMGGPFRIFYAGSQKLFISGGEVQPMTRSAVVNILIDQVSVLGLPQLEIQDRFGHRVGADTFLADARIREEADDAEA